ncbi:MAG: hypothetical protein OXG99_10215, partial [Alphaproteobacteria bacterium]|nr:hypothetical protein [Alphaproteobacteria bacterium]
MDRYEETLRAEISACDEKAAALRDEATAVDIRRKALSHALSLYAKARAGTIAGAAGARRVGTYTARVLDIVREAGSRGLTTREIYQRLEESGEDVRHANIRSILYERKKAGELERQDNGRHRYVSLAHTDDKNQGIGASAVMTAVASDENEASTSASEM